MIAYPFHAWVLPTDIILNVSYHGLLALDPFSSLQRSVFMSGRGFSYFADAPIALIPKCMSNGRALYKFIARRPQSMTVVTLS